MAGKTDITTAADFLPEKLNLASLRRAAANCQGCSLFLDATQTIFGEGPRSASLMLVGETPGDQEDRQGHPFVGPAGKLLNRALQEAGLNRKDVYVTNAVKHFKWEERGKRRLHKKPNRTEIVSCKAWLEAELFVVQPKIIVCLGATAAQTLLGRSFRITQHRGQWRQTDWAPWVLATWHPSAILRARSASARDEMKETLVGDLSKAKEQLAG